MSIKKINFNMIPSPQQQIKKVGQEGSEGAQAKKLVEEMKKSQEEAMLNLKRPSKFVADVNRNLRKLNIV